MVLITRDVCDPEGTCWAETGRFFDHNFPEIFDFYRFYSMMKSVKPLKI
jgi:hypothetical protein